VGRRCLLSRYANTPTLIEQLALVCLCTVILFLRELYLSRELQRFELSWKAAAATVLIPRRAEAAALQEVRVAGGTVVTDSLRRRGKGGREDQPRWWVAGRGGEPPAEGNGLASGRLGTGRAGEARFGCD